MLLGVLWRWGGLRWHCWFDFYGLKLFSFRDLLVSPMYLAVQLLDMSSGRLCWFSDHLELDLLDT